jgi:hypothetical protein
MAISAPRNVLLPLSLSKDPMNPIITGCLAAETAGTVQMARKKMVSTQKNRVIHDCFVFIIPPPFI